MRRHAMVLAILALLPMTAAKADVTECKVITTLPAVINSSGVWCLKQDLTWNGTDFAAIEIQRSFVTLDLNGYTLKRGNSSTQGAAIFGYDLNNITIRNGTIYGFYQGIHFSHPGTVGSNTRSGRHLIEEMAVEQSELFGILVTGDGNTVRGNRIARTRSSNQASLGISVLNARNTLIADNIVSGTSGLDHSIGIQVFSSEMVEVRRNSIFDTKRGRQTIRGINVTGNSDVVTVEGNRIANASGGTDGILGSIATMVSCIDNVVIGYATAISGCNFVSGNLTP
jgi:hypothetical protein